MCRSDISITVDVKMPAPNHMHCGVCRVNYEDYNAHIGSKEHLAQIQVHKSFYDFVDRELEDLNSKAKNKIWKTSPLRLPKKVEVRADGCKRTLEFNSITAGARSDMDILIEGQNGATTQVSKSMSTNQSTLPQKKVVSHFTTLPFSQVAHVDDDGDMKMEEVEVKSN